jgi:hypothetical protein
VGKAPRVQLGHARPACRDPLMPPQQTEGPGGTTPSHLGRGVRQLRVPVLLCCFVAFARVSDAALVDVVSVPPPGREW